MDGVVQLWRINHPPVSLWASLQIHARLALGAFWQMPSTHMSALVTLHPMVCQHRSPRGRRSSPWSKPLTFSFRALILICVFSSTTFATDLAKSIAASCQGWRVVRCSARERRELNIVNVWDRAYLIIDEHLFGSSCHLQGLKYAAVELRASESFSAYGHRCSVPGGGHWSKKT